MLTVHHLGISQSERIVWLCEELGIAYELKCYQRDPETQLAPAEYRALHPLGTAPIITDGDLTLAESGAIIEYIIETYGDGRLAVEKGEANRNDYLFWFHFANGSLMPGRMMDLIIGMMGEAGDAAGDMMQERNRRMYEMMNARLGETDYLAGDELTAADIMALFPITTMRMFAPVDFAAYPNLRAYLNRIGERPAYRRAMEKGDPGMPLQLS
ncbi:MAG: glutathione S-transferase family protein [Alphaproteobacteria bacterium]